jgi:hypothetical protein
MADVYRLRYTRRRDRVLAFIWPPKRRRLRLQQTLVAAGMDKIRAATDPFQRDLMLYGTAFFGPDGQRIDPREVRVYAG